MQLCFFLSQCKENEVISKDVSTCNTIFQNKSVPRNTCCLLEQVNILKCGRQVDEHTDRPWRSEPAVSLRMQAAQQLIVFLFFIVVF